MRWFGVRVVEIKQISAYSCRGMNGNPNAHISEHAFGNALDIAAFTLADGRRITVKGGWRGMPEEQGFLRDVQASACQQFNTVLAPGSNVYHEDHIHVDLMRRASGRAHLPAGRGIRRRGRGAGRADATPTPQRDPYATGSLGGKKPSRIGTGAAARSTRKTSSRTISERSAIAVARNHAIGDVAIIRPVAHGPRSNRQRHIVPGAVIRIVGEARRRSDTALARSYRAIASAPIRPGRATCCRPSSPICSRDWRRRSCRVRRRRRMRANRARSARI